jgi:dTDP-4-dehydrorhamnose 3,5-epimerase
MKFEALPLSGAFAVTPEPHDDERGSFARIWAAAEFAAHGLATRLAECSVSHNPRRETLRGLHYQTSPHQEAKLVTCLRGSIQDVIVDLRIDSPTYRRWHAARLDGETLQALYVPEGLAHGFLTLSDDVLVLYQISEPHDAACARGVRWDDPAFGIGWAADPTIISARDRSYSDYAPASAG